MVPRSWRRPAQRDAAMREVGRGRLPYTDPHAHPSCPPRSHAAPAYHVVRRAVRGIAQRLDAGLRVRDRPAPARACRRHAWRAPGPPAGEPRDPPCGRARGPRRTWRNAGERGSRHARGARRGGGRRRRGGTRVARCAGVCAGCAALSLLLRLRRRRAACARAGDRADPAGRPRAASARSAPGTAGRAPFASPRSSARASPHGLIAHHRPDAAAAPKPRARIVVHSIARLS